MKNQSSLSVLGVTLQSNSNILLLPVTEYSILTFIIRPNADHLSATTKLCENRPEFV